MPGTYIRGIVMRVASVGCFPGAWRRGSWHFQVATVCTYNQVPGTDFSFSASHHFSFLSKRSGQRMPPAERSALYIIRSTRGVSPRRADARLQLRACPYWRREFFCDIIIGKAEAAQKRLVCQGVYFNSKESSFVQLAVKIDGK